MDNAALCLSKCIHVARCFRYKDSPFTQSTLGRIAFLAHQSLSLDDMSVWQHALAASLFRVLLSGPMPPVSERSCFDSTTSCFKSDSADWRWIAQLKMPRGKPIDD